MNATTKITKPTEVSRDTAVPEQLAPLFEAYNGLEYRTARGHAGVNGGDTWLFYKAAEYDADVPPPANLPSIVHRPMYRASPPRPVLYFMIPKETDLLDDAAASRISPILASAEGAGRESFIVFTPDPADDLAGGVSLDNDKIVEAIAGYRRAVVAAVEAREAAKNAEARAAGAASIEAAKSDAPNMVPLIEAYEELEYDSSGGLDGGDTWKFIRVTHHRDAALPTNLPSIVFEVEFDDGDKGHAACFLVPAETELPKHWPSSGIKRLLPKDIVEKCVVFIPAKADDLARADTIDSAAIVKYFYRHEAATEEAGYDREAKELLAKERDPWNNTGSGALYASAGTIDETTPMMVEGLFRDEGTSVVQGNMDDFKSTYLDDMAAHIAAGADFQGRKVQPRPVIIYGLDDAPEDRRLRLRAIEAKLRSKDTPWGNDMLPITVRDHIPEDHYAWRLELATIRKRWEEITYARSRVDEMPTKLETFSYEGGEKTYSTPQYPYGDEVATTSYHNRYAFHCSRRRRREGTESRGFHSQMPGPAQDGREVVSATYRRQENGRMGRAASRHIAGPGLCNCPSCRVPCYPRPSSNKDRGRFRRPSRYRSRHFRALSHPSFRQDVGCEPILLGPDHAAAHEGYAPSGSHAV